MRLEKNIGLRALLSKRRKGWILSRRPIQGRWSDREYHLTLKPQLWNLTLLLQPGGHSGPSLQKVSVPSTVLSSTNTTGKRSRLATPCDLSSQMWTPKRMLTWGNRHSSWMKCWVQSAKARDNSPIDHLLLLAGSTGFRRIELPSNSETRKKKWTKRLRHRKELSSSRINWKNINLNSSLNKLMMLKFKKRLSWRQRKKKRRNKETNRNTMTNCSKTLRSRDFLKFPKIKRKKPNWKLN